MAFAIPDQQAFWNRWNLSERMVPNWVSERQSTLVIDWLSALHRTDLDLVDVGCGTGWLTERLLRFGHVTGTDLADDAVEVARARCPGATFLAGDIAAVPLPLSAFDVVVCLEVLSCVDDQPAFVAHLFELLRPGGMLLLSTPNAPVLRHCLTVPPPGEGQRRQWTDRRETAGLLRAAGFEIDDLVTVCPVATRGVMRLVNAHQINEPLRRVVGDRFDRLKERLGLGFEIVVRCHKPAAGRPLRAEPPEPSPPEPS